MFGLEPGRVRAPSTTAAGPMATAIQRYLPAGRSLAAAYRKPRSSARSARVSPVAAGTIRYTEPRLERVARSAPSSPRVACLRRAHLAETAWSPIRRRADGAGSRCVVPVVSVRPMRWTGCRGVFRCCPAARPEYAGGRPRVCGLRAAFGRAAVQGLRTSASTVPAGSVGCGASCCRPIARMAMAWLRPPCRGDSMSRVRASPRYRHARAPLQGRGPIVRSFRPVSGHASSTRGAHERMSGGRPASPPPGSRTVGRRVRRVRWL